MIEKQPGLLFLTHKKEQTLLTLWFSESTELPRKAWLAWALCSGGWNLRVKYGNGSVGIGSWT